MLVGLAKFSIELEGDEKTALRELSNLAAKLRARFKVSIDHDQDSVLRDEGYLAVAIVGKSEAELRKTLDRIAEVADQSGSGKLVDEKIWIDSIADIEHGESEDSYEGVD